MGVGKGMEGYEAQEGYNSTLTLYNITINDAGIYLCAEPTTMISNGLATTLNLTVTATQGKPLIDSSTAVFYLLHLFPLLDIG